MVRRVPKTILALAIALTLAGAAAAEQRPTVAIMPAQYFQADAQSAENVTLGLVERFEAERYSIIPMDRARQTFQQMGFSPSRNISDAAILQFGRRLGADLVAHPQLLAIRPWRSAGTASTGSRGARAVLYLRVLNVQTGQPLYTRQIAYTFRGPASEAGPPVLSASGAAAAATEVSRPYFERVAGSRQALHRSAHQ